MWCGGVVVVVVRKARSATTNDPAGRQVRPGREAIAGTRKIAGQLERHLNVTVQILALK